jgi:2-methylcitrate dehydratase PrpD
VAIALFEEVRSCVVERLTWHPASPSTRRHIVHGLDLTGNRVAVFREVFANLSGRFIDTLAAHNATARMDPKTIFRVVLGQQCRTLDGIQLYKISLKLSMRSSEEVAFINGVLVS